MPVTVTYDLEDHRTDGHGEPRFIAMTDRLLETLEALGATATIFVVGELAQEHPDLIRRINAAGHELALHGWRHVTFDQIGRGHLGDELRRGRQLLEDLTGAPVCGVRAPIFSLTKATAWAIEEIAMAGFTYSSSVLGAANPQHGWPGAPEQPFRWPNDLIELPCPLLGIGRVRVPGFGGAYVRYVPHPLLVHASRSLGRRPGAWTYLHPYDMDVDEPFAPLPWASWAVSRIVLGRREETIPRLALLVRRGGGAGPPLRDVAATVLAPIWAYPSE